MVSVRVQQSQWHPDSIDVVDRTCSPRIAACQQPHYHHSSDAHISWQRGSRIVHQLVESCKSTICYHSTDGRMWTTALAHQCCGTTHAASINQDTIKASLRKSIQS